MKNHSKSDKAITYSLAQKIVELSPSSNKGFFLIGFNFSYTHFLLEAERQVYRLMGY